MNNKLVYALAVLFVASGLYSGQAAASAAVSDQELAKNECGACHFYYSRDFLPAFSWKKILDNLDNHFGEDASLDENSRVRILSYLAGLRSTEIPIRITKTGWWKQAHGARFRAFAAKNNIKAGNCGSCHR